MIAAETEVDIFVDCTDGTLQLSGKLLKDYDPTNDEGAVIKRAYRIRTIPAARILYVESRIA